MPYGFFVTDTGIEKIAKATQAGEKVKLNQMAVGDAGDPEAEYDYERTGLGHETYRKTMDENDTYEILEENSHVVELIVVIPDEAGAMTLNELGFLDEEGDLIVYGVVEETFKAAGANGSIQTIEVTCYIDFVNTGLENVEIVVGSDGLVLLQQRVDGIEARVTVNETSITNIWSEFSKYVQKRAGYDLSSNDFTQAWIDQINRNKSVSESNTKLVNEKADRLDLQNKVDKVPGKGLSTNDFTNLYKNQIDTNENDIATLKKSVQSLSSSVGGSASGSDLDALKSRVSRLETASSSHVTTLTFNSFKTTTEADIRDLESASSNHVTTSTFNSFKSSVESRLSTIESQLSGLAARLSAVATALEDIR